MFKTDSKYLAIISGVLLIIYSGLSFGNDSCSQTFSFNNLTAKAPSRLFYELKSWQKATKDTRFHPDFIDIMHERVLQDSWKTPPKAPQLLNFLLPKDVYFIGHQLPRSGDLTSIKLGQPGQSLLVRAYYQYDKHELGTNVAFSTRALESNIRNDKKDSKHWLVGTDARAAILFLHGGGTKSTGAHVGESIISHFSHYKIDVVAPDLPWHAEGHREFLGDFKHEIQALGAFARKYIPPHVPLFVWGHSWGSVFAEEIMKMSDQPKNQFKFHDNLKAVMIFSTAVDTAPGQSVRKKLKSFMERHNQAMTRQDEFADQEASIWSNIISDGKVSPIGSFFSMWTIVQNDQSLPSHLGKKYIPALMVVGKHDPLVYIGFEDLFHKYYDTLENVETHYLEKLPYFTNPKGEPQRVGHLLGDYIDRDTNQSVQYSLAQQFIAKHLGIDKIDKEGIAKTASSLITITQLFANNLAFRFFLEGFNYPVKRKTLDYASLISEQLPSLIKDIQQHLSNYATPLIRINQLLDSLEKAKNSKDINIWTQELNEIMLYPHLMLKINNNKLTQALVKLQFDLSHYKTIDEIHGTVRIIKEEFSAFFENLHSNKQKNHYGPIVNKILKADNYDSAKQLIHNEHLPNHVSKKILSLLHKYFIMQSIVHGNYNINTQFLKQNNLSYLIKNPRKKNTNRKHIKLDKIRKLLKELKENIETREQLQDQYNLLSKQKKLISADYKTLSQTVGKQIKLVKYILAEGVFTPPDSLKEDFENSRKDFEELEKESNKMVALLEGLTLPVLEQGIPLSVEQIDHFINVHKQTMTDLNQKYNNYNWQRQELRRRLLATILKEGWNKVPHTDTADKQADKYQQAILGLYGDGNSNPTEFKSNDFDNTFSDSSRKNNYSELIKLGKTMADTEAKIYQINSQIIEAFKNYQDILGQLRFIITPQYHNTSNRHNNGDNENGNGNGNGNKNVEWMRMAANTHHFGTISAENLLNNLPITSDLDTPKKQHDQVKAYIEKHQEDFNFIIGNWHQMESHLPPRLPTDTD